SYCSTQSGTKSTGTHNITTQELCNIIGNEYRRRKRESGSDNVNNDMHAGTSVSTTTYYTKDAGHGKKQKVNKGKPKCDNCSWFRHIAADCHRKVGAKEQLAKKKSTPKGNKGKEHANQAHDIKEDKEMDVAFNTTYDVSMNENDNTIDMYS
ncbi:hypothetical protein PAXRUDRAFT_123743, partial [Paxillus rubicundulus Ve08.2h10]